MELIGIACNIQWNLSCIKCTKQCNIMNLIFNCVYMWFCFPLLIFKIWFENNMNSKKIWIKYGIQLNVNYMQYNMYVIEFYWFWFDWYLIVLI